MKKSFFVLLIVLFSFVPSFFVVNAAGNCASDDDCDLNEECVAEVCVAKSCTGDDECLAGGAKCIAGYCDVQTAVVAQESSASQANNTNSSGANNTADVGVFVPGAGTDQRCWVEEKCKEAEGAFYGSAEGKPNGETITACGGEKNAVGEWLGFCKPAYVAQTEVTFGNTNTFTNIGEFIKFMFRYAIMAAGVVAVVTVVIAGMQWTISGGNAEKISSAKKRIGGAMMGLFLAIMGYSVLNFINPYLVNLRLPQVWMINTQGLAPAYCDALTSSSTVATAFPYGTKKTQSEKQQMSSSADYAVKSQEALCGNEYFVKDTGGQTCSGSFCGGGKICMTQNEVPICKPGMLGGKIGAPASLFCSDLTGNIFDNNLLLIAMCKDGDIEKVNDVDLPNNAREFMFPVDSNLESICGNVDNLAGFYIAGEVNDEGGGLFGGYCKGSPGVLSSGCDDWHAVGKNGPHNCSLNLGKFGATILFGQKPVCNNDWDNSKACSCAALSNEPNVQILVNDKTFTSHLITLDELKKGYICNIEINRTEFPALNNSSSLSGECSTDDNTDCWDDQNSL